MSQQNLPTRRETFRQAAAICLAASLAKAQEPNRKSPHETTSIDLDGKKISITYGRPSLKGRKMLGEENPYGKVWRLGADEATKITVNSNTVINGALELPPGSYSLFAIPYADHWTMIVNKVADQWGAFKYEQSEDLGRFDLKTKHLDSPVEEFKITLTKEGNNVAQATFAWGDTSVSTTLKMQ